MMLSLLDWASLKMKRLEKSGASLVTPSLGVSELKAALNALGVREKFDDKAVSDIYFKISAVIGVWRDDLNAQDASETAKAFLSTARNLEKASTLLSGRQTGIRTSVETYVTNETIRLWRSIPPFGMLRGLSMRFANRPPRSPTPAWWPTLSWRRTVLAEDRSLGGMTTLPNC
jgi:hypothetical protein